MSCLRWHDDDVWRPALFSLERVRASSHSAIVVTTGNGPVANRWCSALEVVSSILTFSRGVRFPSIPGQKQVTLRTPYGMVACGSDESGNASENHPILRVRTPS